MSASTGAKPSGVANLNLTQLSGASRTPNTFHKPKTSHGVPTVSKNLPTKPPTVGSKEARRLKADKLVDQSKSFRSSGADKTTIQGGSQRNKSSDRTAAKKPQLPQKAKLSVSPIVAHRLPFSLMRDSLCGRSARPR